MKKTLLAFALIVSSLALWAEELPLKIGDWVTIYLDDGKDTALNLAVTDIKGKWFEAVPRSIASGEIPGAIRSWYNSEKVRYFIKTSKQ
ncbi:hypothetical protein EBX31_14450 [bacterium]|nr:hypothetical protein [bacterium]